MKKIISIVLLLAFVAIGVAVASETFKAGRYEGKGQGYHGEVTVRVTVGRNGKISAIDIRNHSDTEGFMNGVKDQLIPAMIDKQSAEVDIVTGATGSSNGLIAAVRDALSKAR